MIQKLLVPLLTKYSSTLSLPRDGFDAGFSASLSNMIHWDPHVHYSFVQFKQYLGCSSQIIKDACNGKYENPPSHGRVDNMWPLWRAHRYYESKWRFSRLSESAIGERDWLFLTNLNGRGKQRCWNWKMSYGNWKFDRDLSVGVTRTCRVQLSVAGAATDPL